MPLPLVFAIPAGIMSVITVIQTIFTVLSLLVAVVQLIAGFDMELSFLTDVKGPAATIMQTMYSTITGFLPFSFESSF